MKPGKMGPFAREAAAQERREAEKVSREIKEARARILEKREAAFEVAREQEQAAREDKPDAITAVLLHASIDELHEMQRAVGQTDGRRMSNLVADVIQRKRSEELAAAIRRSSGGR